MDEKMDVAVREAYSVRGCAGACQSLNNAAQLRARSVVSIKSHQLSKSWHRLLLRRELCVIGFTRLACLRRPSPLQHTTQTVPLQHNAEKPTLSAWWWRIWLHSTKEETQFGMSKGEIMKRFSWSRL
jgi:hypothetical protein